MNRRYDEELKQNLFTTVEGQHIAARYVAWALKGHIEDEEPKHALSFVFMGTTGTGKNFVSQIIADALFRHAPRHVHYYSGLLDFPHKSEVEQYKSRLQKEITENVRKCERAVFIFDEIEKAPAGLIDGVKPFLDFHRLVKNVNYRKAIFIFLTNGGGEKIVDVYRSLRKKGIPRESMMYNHFEGTLIDTLFGDGGMFSDSMMISDHLISFYLPFLPLERSHVIRCTEKEMLKKKIEITDGRIDSVLSKIVFDEDISKSGCKKVADYVSVERYRTLQISSDSHREL